MHVYIGTQLDIMFALEMSKYCFTITPCIYITPDTYTDIYIPVQSATGMASRFLVYKKVKNRKEELKCIYAHEAP